MKTNILELPEKGMNLRRLLGGWRDVYDDIRALCRTLDELPGVCRCGHGPAHLERGCPCCGHTATEYVPACDDCEKQLAQLRQPIDEIVVDRLRFFPVVRELLARHDADAAERLRDIDGSISAFVRSFEQLVFAEGAFRDDCRASHLTQLKESVAALRSAADALNKLV
jgi:hypothetical protein